nr:LysR substrate-binding domain-containing protein [Salmonella enterica]
MKLQRAENYARDLKEIKKSLVRVVGAPLIACAFLPQIIHAFKRQHPHTHVQLIDKPMSQLQKSIMLGEADFGIGPERPLEPEIDKQTLFTTEIALYCQDGTTKLRGKHPDLHCQARASSDFVVYRLNQRTESARNCGRGVALDSQWRRSAPPPPGASSRAARASVRCRMVKARIVNGALAACLVVATACQTEAPPAATATAATATPLFLPWKIYPCYFFAIKFYHFRS